MPVRFFSFTFAHSFSYSPALAGEHDDLRVAANLAATSVDAVGETLPERVRAIPWRIREVARHGLRIGAATAITEGEVQGALDPAKLMVVERTVFEEAHIDLLVGQHDALARGLVARIDIGDILLNALDDN